MLRSCRRLFALVVLLALVACGSGAPMVAPPGRTALAAAAERRDALALSDELERLIEAGVDTEKDREFAHDAIERWEEKTAGYAFARAAIAGRLAEKKGLGAIALVGEVERYAETSRALDPKFRDGAATRMLGTLYVLAPSSMLERGDSEKGLEILEKLAAERPDVPENQLRLAEAFLALGDEEPAKAPLCKAIAARAKLRRDHQALLGRLVKDAGGEAKLACPPAP